MAGVDKDVDVKKLVLNDEQFDSSSNKNQIPEAGDQSANFPQEELFKQNIQMGEASLSTADESIQSTNHQDGENINSPKISNKSYSSQDVDSKSNIESS